MIQHELIKKGRIAHSLITPVRYPNVLLPVKVVIKDVHFDEYNPKYLVKILKFYDKTHVVKTYFMNERYHNTFKRKGSVMRFDKEVFRTSEEIVNYMDGFGTKYYVVAESINTWKTKLEMTEVFNKLQDYFIMRSFYDLQTNMVRTPYRGKFKMSTKKDYHDRLRRMIVDRVATNEEEWQEFIKTLK